MSLPLFAALASAPSRVARIALPVPVDSLFDYAVPEALAADAEPGRRVRVRMGSRALVGVIVALADAPEIEEQKLRPIDRVLDATPALAPTLIDILREEAAEVLCPIGLALAAALPPSSLPKLAHTVALTARGREALRAGAARAEVAALLERLAKGPRTEAVLRRAGFAAGAIDALAEEGLVERVVREPAKRARKGAARPESELPEGDGTPPALTAEQAAAGAELAAAIDAREPRSFLLHGVTGSGKTEVYLRAIERALAGGRQALVLVPEITLTHQIVGRLRARFGDRLAILHSGLRPAERTAEWERLRLGATPIAVGARSALFAPLQDLGVIVLDEEHDGAYKNEEGFRYHARTLAARRARAARCPLVLGSATPSLETRAAADRGELRRLVLSHRIGGRPLPAVELVDLAKERAALPRGRKLILTRILARALGDVLAEGGQALLFLNRRGFSTQIHCFACGRVEHCPNCDIALVFHADEAKLRCHYCDHELDPPDRCAGCGSDENALLGIGTERVEEDVRTRFPEARIARLDRDVAVRRGATAGVLRGLRERKIDVVVGTQMLAKGHDFPGVRLVGVVNADIGLHLPDFRAAERTFQLLTQVAGRAGRGGEPGRVVVQTWVPEHYALRPVVHHDYETFYAAELAQRAALGYPPCGSLARAVVSAPELEEAEQAVRALADAARTAAERAGSEAGPLEILGPGPAPLARLRGRHRMQLLVKGRERSAVRAVAIEISRAATALPRAVRATLDTDPYAML
jgi:primosomal protein N' (replication factor Y) (superfamily II helicase)